MVAGVALLAGCGDIPSGGPQDSDEPPGNYEVEVLEQSFSPDQTLARRSSMEIVVRNADSRPLPNVSVTLGDTAEASKKDRVGSPRTGDFERHRPGTDLADPSRPQFVLNKAPIDYIRVKTQPNGSLVAGEVRSDVGDDPTYVDTYDLGPLKPGATKRFRWSVTAVEAGPYTIAWLVNAGLDGKAKAVLAEGGVPRGSFTGTVGRAPPRARVDFEDGEGVEER